MQKAVMTFRELLTLLSPIQHIEADTTRKENKMKQRVTIEERLQKVQYIKK